MPTKKVVGRKNSIRGSGGRVLIGRWGSREHRKAVTMMQTTEDRDANDSVLFGAAELEAGVVPCWLPCPSE